MIFNNFLHNTFLLLSFAFLLSCQKSEPTPTDTPLDQNDPNQYGTPFAEIPATADIVMYEINERAFSVSGDFQGIMPRLDSIKDLGVNVIWLMPIHPIGKIKTVNSPYCIQNFTEVNPEYGDLEKLRTLVTEAHNRKIAVILDWAANHTSWDNPWIQNKTWYSQDANGNIISPAGTNWQDVADLNFDNMEMRQEMIKAMKYWVLQANVDGFRCDAADFVPFSFWKQAIDSLRKIPNRDIIMLAEGARKDHFNAGFEINFGWEFFSKAKSIFKSNQSASEFLAAHQSEYAGIPSGTHRLRFTSNHDECAWDDTPLGLFGGKNGSVAAFVATAYMGGIPLIYNGQEVGCPVKLPFFSKSPIDWKTNPDMLKTYKKLIAIRLSNAALRSGSLEQFAHNDIVSFRRKSGTNEVFVLVNTRSANKSYTLPTVIQNSAWKDAISNENVTLGISLDLKGYEYRVLVK
ncbi:MAG TPA: alpha-amylase family glycosyl hydrolase [Saprospiraceae bacterium]|nr:alpha-amylase family glycosyl hydrolase [Saprospiraceae bacterium]